ncbi:MAG TPA: cytochrome c oxidase subunit 3 family protein [Candidatus Krumholzibacteria bacterium]|nr:cytochrome c oxidase subunit 3 family protein [Candidatus Krumholzibacteria bacterium]HPD70716.1 cytochrome c oxidase subunit 3 family protein [Candidatus Krumholzibacteria bacterium]HRY39584.1 cytochrome c oxidase subunit 3 family protein [Candidatus Krumholzibacteria bacterium]
MSATATPRYEGKARLAHYFDTRAQQYDSHKLGMWLFLVTEVLMFGGLFCAYAIYRANHPEIFLYAHTLLDKNLGAINTVVLLFSSFTMAWSVRAAMLGQRRLLAGLLAITLLCGFAFLGIKGVEYNHKWQHGLLWGDRFDYAALQEHGAGAGAAAAGGAGAEGQAVMSELDRAAEVTVAHGHEPAAIPRNVHIFFGIYFVMTGLHGIHVIAGMVVIGWLLRRAVRSDFGSRNYTAVDLGGLYWHLVDLIWIFLFPLLYLIH